MTPAENSRSMPSHEATIDLPAVCVSPRCPTESMRRKSPTTGRPVPQIKAGFDRFIKMGILEPEAVRLKLQDFILGFTG